MEINRIKVALVETRIKNKWLAKKLEKDEYTISKWFTNTIQPFLENLLNITLDIYYTQQKKVLK